MVVIDRMIRYALDHPAWANVAMLVTWTLGYVACLWLPVQFLPDFETDVVVVIAKRDDASAVQMKEEVQEVISPHLHGLQSLYQMESIAREGVCYWILRFDERYKSSVIDDVHSRVGKVKLDNLDIQVMHPRMRHPVLSFVLWGPHNLSELAMYATRIKQQLIARGIDEVAVKGLDQADVNLEVSSAQLHQAAMPMTMMSRELMGDFGDQSAISKHGQKVSISTPTTNLGMFENDPAFQSSVFGGVHTPALFDMQESLPRQTSRVMYHNQPAVSFTLYRIVGGSDIFSLYRIYEQWRDQFLPQLGKTVQLQPYEQTWQLISYRIQLLVENGLVGLVLVFLVLGVFFHRSLAIWIASGIPVCIAISCVMLYSLGGSINFLSTFAFVMALGIIVDDTIVVAEQAYTEFCQGHSPRQAVLNACRIMWVPILAASFTTVASFLPLLILPGDYGKIMIDIPRVIICVLIASIVECFFILPRHLYTSLQRLPTTRPRWQAWLQDTVHHWQHHQLHALLTCISRRAYVTISAAMVVIFIPVLLVLFGFIRFSFFPSPPHRVILMDTSFHAGVSEKNVLDYLSQANQALSEVNHTLSQGQSPIVQTALQFTYQKTQRSLVQLNRGRAPNHASMVLSVSQPDQRSVTNQALMDAWAQSIEKTPYINHISMAEPAAGPPVPDLQLLIKGKDAQSLKHASRALQAKLSEYQGVTGIRDNMPVGPVEIRLELNQQAKALGVSRHQLERELASQLSDIEIKSQTISGDQMHLQLRLNQDSLEHPGLISQLPIAVNGKMVPLGTLVDEVQIQSFSDYYSFNSQPGVLVAAETNLSGNTVGEIIYDLKRNVIDDLEKTYKVVISFETQQRSQQEAIAGLRSGVIFGLVLIYVVLAWVLKSYTWPFAIMAIIPVGVSGALWGHYFLGMHVTVLSIFGIFGLTGIVVNDSIILLHRFQHARKQHEVANAMIHACCERFRAVMLTTVTTVVGLLPLLMSTSLQAQFVVPLAVSLCAGLTLATIMLIGLLPAIAALIEKNPTV